MNYPHVRSGVERSTWARSRSPGQVTVSGAQVAFLVLRDRVRIPSDNGGHGRPILLLADGSTLGRCL